MEDSLTNRQGSKGPGHPYQDCMGWNKNVPLDTAGSRSTHKIRKKNDLVSQTLRTDPGRTSALPIHEDVGVFPFLALPKELRNLIYKDLLTLRSLTTQKWHGTAHTSILYTCRQIRDEAQSILYSNHLFLLFTGEILSCDVRWVSVVEYSETGTDDEMEMDKDESWRAWAQVPAYYYKCDSFRIQLGMDCWDDKKIDQDSIEEAALRPIMNLNSVVYTILLKHPSLRKIHFKLITVGADCDPRLSYEFMRNFELSCLDTLARLQGLKKVTLEGFRFQDPAYIASLKEKCLNLALSLRVHSVSIVLLRFKHPR